MAPKKSSSADGKSGSVWTRRDFLATAGAASMAPIVAAHGLCPRRHYEETGEAPSIYDLRRYLQMALEVEHATIPTYLAALYSIKPGANIEIATLIREIVVEEMLHMALVANLMNAIGGRPRTAFKSFVPDYPAALPHSRAAFAVPLEKFSYQLVHDVFLKIEQPKREHAKPEGVGFATIGQFYEFVTRAFEVVHHRHGDDMFCGGPKNQIRPNSWTGTGDLYEIGDLPTARRAMTVIVEQGEGATHGDLVDDYGQLSHYGKFRKIERAGEVPFDPRGVWPVIPNPKMANLASYPRASRLCLSFNDTYSHLLDHLDTAFNGQPDSLEDVVIEMFELKQRAQALTREPLGDTGFNAGPSFEYVSSHE